MVAICSHAGRRGAYAALGIALALSLSPQAIAQTDNVHRQAQSGNHRNDPGNTQSIVAPAASFTNQGNCPCSRIATKASPLSVKDHLWRFIWRLGRDPIAVLTFLLFVVGGRQFRLNRITAQRQLRAYVTASPNFIRSFDDNNFCKFEAGLRNDGLTPAFSVRQRLAIELITYPLPQEIYLPEPAGAPSPPIVLFPRDTFKATYTHTRLFTAREITDIKEAKVAIVLYGVISYEDSFRKKHWTKFSAYVGADADTLEKLTSNYKPSDLTINFTMTPQGNDADR